MLVNQEVQMEEVIVRQTAFCAIRIYKSFQTLRLLSNFVYLTDSS